MRKGWIDKKKKAKGTGLFSRVRWYVQKKKPSQVSPPEVEACNVNRSKRIV
jgi:hypothetical protein